MHRKQSSKATKRRGTHDQRTRANVPAGPEASKADHLHRVGTTTATTKEDESSTTKAPQIKNILVFRPLLSPKIPRKHQAPPKNHLLLPCFDALLTLWSAGGLWEQPGSREQPGAYKRGHPPPIWGAARAFYPHNFSHRKYRKKSPWSDWKKFRKKFVGKCFGEK